MSGVQVTVPLQIMCRLMVAGQANQNVTLPSIQNSSLVGTIDSPVLPSGYVEFPEFGLAYKFVETNSTFNEARIACLKENGQLAVVNNRRKVEEIFHHFPLLVDAWVGLSVLRETTDWITIDGKSVDNLPWAMNNPSGIFDCGYLARESNGLVELSCNWKFPFVCEIALRRN